MTHPDATRYDGERNDVVEYLRARHWRTSVRTTPELNADNGFKFGEGPAVVAFGDIRYVAAEQL